MTMITYSQIMRIASAHLDKGGYFDDLELSDWAATDESLLRFARAIYLEGYDDGCYDETGGQ